MSKNKQEVNKFLDESNKVLTMNVDSTEEFAEVIKRETLRQAKDQLAVELAPLLNRLANIEEQNTIIIRLLKNKLDFDVQEKKIFDLLEKALEKEG